MFPVPKKRRCMIIEKFHSCCPSNISNTLLFLNPERSATWAVPNLFHSLLIFYSIDPIYIMGHGFLSIDKLIFLISIIGIQWVFCRLRRRIRSGGHRNSTEWPRAEVFEGQLRSCVGLVGEWSGGDICSDVSEQRFRGGFQYSYFHGHAGVWTQWQGIWTKSK